MILKNMIPIIQTHCGKKEKKKKNYSCDNNC